MKAVVIGTGFESLASALRLRALGHDVDVLEAESTPGGWARSFHLSGQAVEIAPPTISSPWVFDDLFALFHERRADFITFVPTRLYRRNLYADGSHLDIVSSIEEQEAAIETLSPQDARRYRSFLNHCEEQTRRAALKSEREQVIDLRVVLKSATIPLCLRKVSSLWRCSGRYFTDRRVRQAFSWQSVAAGFNPLVAPAHCVALHSAERDGGGWIVRGGVSALIQELVSLAERHGVRFHYNHTVAALARDGAGNVRSLYSAHRGERVVTGCDLVVWGGETRSLYSMLPDEWLSPLERFGLRPSVPSFGMYSLFLKLKRAYPEVPDYTVIFSERWEGLLSQLGTGARLPKDPMLSVHRLSPAHSPNPRDEGELFSVFVPVPHLARYSGWKFDGPGFKDSVLTKLRERVFLGLTSSLVFAESIDPRYARDVLNHPLGAPFPSAPAASRGEGVSFHYRMRNISNLFLCGGRIPGVCGVPGAVLSARAVAESVAKEFVAVAPYERLADIAARSVA
jgi:phytoene desaturase